MAIEQCSYKKHQEAGLHYPVGSKPDTFITPAEKENKFCPGLKGKQKDLYKEFTETRVNSRKVSVSLFSSCFLEEVLALSRTAGREIAVHLDANLNFIGRIGEIGRVRKIDVTTEWALLHTHPRATSESTPFTLHSPNDLLGDMIYSLGHSQIIIITQVPGSICGEPMEKPLVAFAGKKIYVNDNTQLVIVKSIIDLIFTDQSPLIQAGRERLAAYGITQASNFEVIIDSNKIAETARRYKVKPEAETQLLEYFKTQLRVKK